LNKNKRKHKDCKTKSKKKVCVRSVKRHPILCRADDGTLREATFEDSTWWRLYIETPPTGKRLLKIFRNRFRLPYDEFEKLVKDILSHELFARWTHHDACGNKPSDVRLLLLGSLRYLG
jgi:hypothetical protein